MSLKAWTWGGLGRSTSDRAGERSQARTRDAIEAVRGGVFAPLEDRLVQDHGIEVRLRIEPGIGDAHPVAWEVRGTRAAFVFDASLLEHGHRDVLVERWIQTVPLLLDTQRRLADARADLWLNLADFGTRPGLAFCDHRPEFSLIPDPQFLGSEGYAARKETYDRLAEPWASRRPVALWRGQTTGWCDAAGAPVASWRDLPRVRLCEIARTVRGRSLLDASLSGLNQIDDPDAVNEIRAKGLLGPPMPWQDFRAFKYQVDIDGNSNAWEGLFTKLCSGGCVLKVASGHGFRQWYYDRLVPWFNIVPVEADMTDLLDKIEWLRAHDDVARIVGQNGLSLARSMAYAHETVLASRIVEGLLRGAPPEKVTAQA